jgi:dephospho-CoA kinase
VIVVGLTGGIGAGKSTVSTMLAERGAVIVDADAIVRELQAPGAPLLDVLAARFGSGIIDPHGALDRAALAAIVFDDRSALDDLNALVHPAVRAEIAVRLRARADTDDVVVLDIPLVTDPRRDGMEALVVVDAPVEVAVERLVTQRGMTEADARARVDKQLSRHERVAIADRVIDNGGDRESLVRQVDEAWRWMRSLPPVVLDSG